MSTGIVQPAEIKRRLPQRESRRKRAQDLIEPVRALLPEQFRNTGDTETVARYNEVTRASVTDVVMECHGERIDEHGARLARIESQLGIRKPVASATAPFLVRRIA